ncbi:MAG: 3D domain-containing protein [Carboxydocellales bacterium]
MAGYMTRLFIGILVVIILTIKGGWVNEEAAVQKALQQGAFESASLSGSKGQSVGLGGGTQGTGIKGAGLQTELGARKAAARNPDHGIGQGPKQPSITQSKKSIPGANSRGGNRGSGGDSAELHSAGSFLITAYTAGHESTGKRPGDKGYGEVAISTPKKPVYAKEGRTIAADWAVLPPGTIVEIEGLDGRYQVEDHGSYTGRQIDLFKNDVTEARKWGKKYREIWIVERVAH